MYSSSISVTTTTTITLTTNTGPKNTDDVKNAQYHLNLAALQICDPLSKNVNGATYHSSFVDKIDENLLPGTKCNRYVNYQNFGVTNVIITTHACYAEVIMTKNKWNPVDGLSIKFVVFRGIEQPDMGRKGLNDSIMTIIEYKNSKAEECYLTNLLDYCSDYAFDYKNWPKNTSTARVFFHFMLESLTKYLFCIYCNETPKFSFVQASDTIFQLADSKFF